MRNYWKATVAVLISVFVFGCTKSGADFPDGTQAPTTSKTTKPVGADTTKSVTPPVTKPDTTSKPTTPVTTKPTTPVTTPPTPPVTTKPTTPVTTTPPVTTKPTTPVTTKPTTPVTTTPPVTTKPTTPVTTKPTTPVTTTPVPPVTTKPTTPVTTKPTTPVTPTPPVTTKPTTPVTTKPTTPVTATPAPPVTTKPTTPTAPVTTKPTTPVTTKPVVSPPKATTPVVKTSSYKLAAPIAYVGKSNITINGDSINGGLLPCISLINCTNIHITHCKLVNSTGYGVFINGCTNILVDSSYIANVRAGVLAEDCYNGNIRVQYNQMKNMLGPFPHADFIQYGHIQGPNNRIIGNKLENIQGQSNPEDAINLFMCDGSPSDPILVSNNWIRGGGPSLTGGGITVGDQGGSYETIKDNILVNSGYGGVNCAGGNHIVIINNTIYSKSFAWSGFGLGSNNYTTTPTFSNTTTGNKVNWIAGHWGGYQRDTVYRAGSGPTYNPMPTGWNNTNTLKAPINESILPAVLIDFK